MNNKEKLELAELLAKRIIEMLEERKKSKEQEIQSTNSVSRLKSVRIELSTLLRELENDNFRLSL